MIKVTSIICTHNRSGLLLKTIKSINDASKPDQANLSILVIANACKDDTEILLQNYQKRQVSEDLIKLNYTVEPKPGKSYALNTALSLISEGWICFIDDDHRLDGNYFVKVIEAIHQHPETRMFCGKVIPDWTGEEPPWAHDKGEFKITPFPVPYFDLGDEKILLSEKSSIPGGGNLIVAYDVFKKTGQFSEALGPKGHNLMGSEDSDFILRALSENEKLIYIPDIIQYHYVNPKSFKLSYLLTKSYQRNKTITLARCPKHSPIPSYLWIKMLRYTAGFLFSFDSQKKRFFITRLAGIFGQMAGFLHAINKIKS